MQNDYINRARNHRKELAEGMYSYLKKETLFDMWMPAFDLEDTGHYIKVILSIQVPTGAFDADGDIERVEFSAKTMIDKHLVLYDGISEATVCEFLVLQLIQMLFSELADHFISSQQTLTTSFGNLVVQEFDKHVQANNPKPAPPALLAPAE